MRLTDKVTGVERELMEILALASGDAAQALEHLRILSGELNERLGITAGMPGATTIELMREEITALLDQAGRGPLGDGPWQRLEKRMADLLGDLGRLAAVELPLGLTERRHGNLDDERQPGHDDLGAGVFAWESEGGACG